MNENLVTECLRMFRERRDFFIKEARKSENEEYTSIYLTKYEDYSSAVEMLQYAINGNLYCLSAFDSFGEDK